MNDTLDSLQSVIDDLRTYAQAIRTSPTCSCNECDLCAWIAIDPDTFADRLTALQSTEWQTLESVPHIGEVVLFYIPGKRQCMNRADDFHSGRAHWLEGATHWRYLDSPTPPKESNHGT